MQNNHVEKLPVYIVTFFRGYLTGKIARGFAPEDSRVAWSEKELKNRPIEAAPSLSTFADDERVWKTIDSLEAVAAETSASNTLYFYLIYFL